MSTTSLAPDIAGVPSIVGYSTLVGLLIGMPFSWPAPPLYWFAFIMFIACLANRPFSILRIDSLRNAAVWLMISLALLSNAVGLVSAELDSIRILTTSVFFIFFTFGGLVVDKRGVLNGFVWAMFVWAIFIVVSAIYLRIDQYGVYLFTIPDFRLWGGAIFPDWPNYLAFMLSLAFMLNIFLFRRYAVAGIQIFAAILTTSRTPLLAIGLCVIAMCFMSGRLQQVGKWIILGVLIAIVAFVLSDFELNKDLVARMLVYSDRESIYDFALGLVMQSPWVGHGAILLDNSVGFDGPPSFHNSYLDIAVRHGIIALIIFIYLLLPTRKDVEVGGGAFIAVILLFLIGSMFQNFLKHPHIILVYAVIINSGYLFKHHVTRK